MQPQREEPEPQEFVVWDEPAPAEPPREDLDGLRIQRIAALRRGLYRIRSYFLVGMWACFGAAAQCVWLIVRQVRREPWDWRAVALLACIPVFVLVGIWMGRKARRLRVESGRA